MCGFTARSGRSTPEDVFSSVFELRDVSCFRILFAPVSECCNTLSVFVVSSAVIE